MPLWRAWGLPWRVSACTLCVAAILSSTAAARRARHRGRVLPPGPSALLPDGRPRRDRRPRRGDRHQGVEAHRRRVRRVHRSGARIVARCAASSACSGRSLSSHFYTSDPAECEWVKTLPPWQFEKIAYYVHVAVERRLPGRHDAGLPQLLQRPDPRRQPPVHGRPHGGGAPAAQGRVGVGRHRDVLAAFRRGPARRRGAAARAGVARPDRGRRSPK